MLPLSELTDPAAVNSALDEFDQLGREAFLAKYGYGKALAYYVRRNGKLYDSKAIAGVAIKYANPARGPLSNMDFSGGESQVQRVLERLGFEVVVQRNAIEAPLAPVSSVDPIETFAASMQRFLRELSLARAQPFRKIDDLWKAMEQLQERIEAFPPVRARPHLAVNISVGQGNWASVPWISILNTRVTRSTQEGVYVVFLISTELQDIFLTLNQGTTTLVRELGQAGAQAKMIAVAETARARLQDLPASGYALDNAIKLGAKGWLGKNYEIGTIAHTDFRADDLPSDERVGELLEIILDAYDRVVEAPQENPTFLDAEEDVQDLDEGPPARPEPYTLADALEELFLDQAALERLLAIWRLKKNLILQGAPGVGKSFVAKRLAYLLLGAKDTGRIATIQFHQSYSYEDFVQGYRPDGKGGFELRSGVFHRFCEKADLSPGTPHIFIIDEINRGNLSKILGELMLLIEHDKRGPGWATTLTYAQPEHPPFYIPENIYVLGMMNTADRSLSLVDYALRRRFSFASLDPMFSSVKFREHLKNRGVPGDVTSIIVERMGALNQAIGDDRANLGPGYRIGHSFFVPPEEFIYDGGWYRRVIETEIYPLLDEYWFDDRDKALDWRAKLLDGMP